jgi:hypothetical protein
MTLGWIFSEHFGFPYRNSFQRRSLIFLSCDAILEECHSHYKFSSKVSRPKSFLRFGFILYNSSRVMISPKLVFHVLVLYPHLMESRDIEVGIATGYWLDDWGVRVRVPVWSRIFSSLRRPDRLWGSSSLQSNGYRWRFTVGKAGGEWSVHTRPTSAEVKKKIWFHTSTPPYAFMA